MRRKLPFILGGIVVFVSMYLAFEDRQTDTAISDKRVTFIAPVANNGYWGQMAIAIQEAGEEAGIDVKCVGFLKEDIGKQISYIESTVMADADAIITAGVKDSDSFKRAIEQASEAGIPVILIDSDIKDSARLCYIGIDNYEAGKEAAYQLADLCGEKGKLAVIVCNQDNANQQERLAGFQDVIATYAEMEIEEILDREANVMLLKEEIMKMLEENPEITAVFCTEGYSSRAMSQVVTEFPGKYGYINSVVFDANDDTEKAVKAGMIDSIIEQDPRSMGRRAMKILADYFDGNTEDITDNIIPIQIITQENIDKSTGYEDGDVIWHIY